MLLIDTANECCAGPPTCRCHPSPGCPDAAGARAAVRLLARLADDRRVRYLAAGGFSAAVYYGLFAAGWLALSHVVSYLAMSVIASTLTTFITFPVYRYVVFRAGAGVLTAFLRFYVVCTWALLFNLAGLWLLADQLGVHPLVAQAIVIALCPLINYQIGRLWAFRPSPARTD
ncbi:GtrA family protein [Krasilnikovia sp. M28-CT-15]|uniref:GtrA family protein n=1 Tax=Krasilnikovia sp. M28-CT-15 TaxID=3373540 RepID=UPI00399C5FAC